MKLSRIPLYFLRHGLTSGQGKWKVRVKSLCCVRLFETPWTITCRAPPTMGFSRPECWSGLTFPSPGDLPHPGIGPRSPALQQTLNHLSHKGSPSGQCYFAKENQVSITIKREKGWWRQKSNPCPLQKGQKKGKWTFISQVIWKVRILFKTKQTPGQRVHTKKCKYDHNVDLESSLVIKGVRRTGGQDGEGCGQTIWALVQFDHTQLLKS